MDGEIRSAFLMTEPEVASSDATNIQCQIETRGDEYVINGRKWWSIGRRRSALQDRNPDGQDRSRRRASTATVDDPGAARRAGREIKRHLTVFGYDDAPHGHMEIELTKSACRPSNLLLGEGRGFEIAQGRLGPGAFTIACAPSAQPRKRWPRWSNA